MKRSRGNTSGIKAFLRTLWEQRALPAKESGAKDRSRLQRNLTQEQIDFIFPPLNLEEFLQHQSERSRSRGSTEEEIRQDEQHWLDLWESWTDSRDSLSWDFVGYSREWPVKKGKACLVEVKTSRSLNNQSP